MCNTKRNIRATYGAGLHKHIGALVGDVRTTQTNLLPRPVASGSLSRRQVRPRISAVHTSPQMSPQEYTSTLQDILTRYQLYAQARASGKNGASKKVVSKLPRSICSSTESCKHHCTICLQDIVEGQTFTKLPCGHVFHFGDQGKNDNDACKGIQFWLEDQRTCPHCRSEMEPEVKPPTVPEQVIVPLLNRQFNLIQEQSRLIERQRRELEKYHALERRRAFEGLKPDLQSLRKRKRNADAVDAHWQDDYLHHDKRVKMLNDVTTIALGSLNGRLLGCTAQKLKKLTNLAAKVELILYSEAPNLETYLDRSTLKKRVLDRIRQLIKRARELKELKKAQEPVVLM